MAEDVSGRYLRMWELLEAYFFNLRANTARTYRAAFNLWCEHLGVVPLSDKGATRLTSAIPLDAMRWMEALRRRKGQKPKFGGKHTASAATVRQRINILRAIYSVLQSEGYVLKNPIDERILRIAAKDKEQKRPTLMIPFEKCMELVAAPSAYTQEGKRDRCVLALLLGGALRESEVRNILVSDVTVEHDKTTVRLRQTKNGDDTTQLIGTAFAKYVNEFYFQRAAEVHSFSEPLITEYFQLLEGSSGKRICDKGVYRIFKRWAEHIGLGHQMSPHSARATAITYLCEIGIPHREIAAFSRHSSVQMVERYDKLRNLAGNAAASALNFDKPAKK